MMRRQARSFCLTIAPIIAAALLSACNQQAEDTESAQKKKRPPHPVIVQTVAAEPVAIDYSRTGTVTLRNKARIHAQEEGRVTHFPWFEGDRVKQGITLLRLDDTLLKAELKKAQADANQAMLDLKRINNLISKKVASREQLTSSRTRLSITQAEVEILKARLAWMDIKAPFDGVVSTRLVEAEDFVSKKTHLLTLIDPASLYVEANFSELLLGQVRQGTAVKVRIDAAGNKTFPAIIRRIHPVLDPATRQAVVEIDFKQAIPRIHAGQFARVHFSSVAEPRIMLPFNAVQQGRNNQFVYVLQDDKAKKVDVTSGIKKGDRIEIIEGLTPGQQVITQGFLGLSDGKKVVVKTNS
ncbi:MAG: efflux RND transporter periplasmic adaptor subunit [Gammaproteobacteria bacterium]|nr:efflux RND transporter periplasmic adaptor subunit [Gammaproteobacteria bacterium]NNJ92961.1 efflux RND transporter periplasmic adaptor subunit [Gammaproteobacteria bacterium]